MPHVLDDGSAYSRTSSEDFSMQRLREHSRSASGTSETQYDAIDLPPKAYMDDYLSASYDPVRSVNQDRSIRNTPDLLEHDPTSLHLLVENAAAESQFYDVLSPEQLDALRQQESSLSKQVEALRRKLYLESKVRNAAQSLSRLSQDEGANGHNTRSDFESSSAKCEDLARELWRAEKQLSVLREQRLKHTAGVLQLQHQKTAQNATQRASRMSFSDWFGGFNSHALANTPDGIMDISGDNASKSPSEADNIMNDLWNLLQEGDRDMQHPHEQEEFSHQAFSQKVQHLCRQARDLSDQQSILRNELETARQEAHFAQQHEEQDSQKEVELMNQLDALQKELVGVRREHETRTQQVKDYHNNKQDLESEVVRLQTELTVVRAELDASGGRISAAHEKIAKDLESTSAKHKAAEARVTVLEKELRELVTEHEGLVKLGVAAEREREGLEGTIDRLKEEVEAMTTKMSEERVMNMARSPTAASGTRSVSNANEGSSMGVMRTEFKKIMREARADHYKQLKDHHDERRKLENIIRTLRKENPHDIPSHQAASAPTESS